MRFGFLIFFKDFLGVDKLILDKIERTLLGEVNADLKNVGEEGKEEREWVEDDEGELDE